MTFTPLSRLERAVEFLGAMLGIVVAVVCASAFGLGLAFCCGAL